MGHGESDARDAAVAPRATVGGMDTVVQRKRRLQQPAWWLGGVVIAALVGLWLVFLSPGGRSLTVADNRLMISPTS